ncbi:hypothetical protein VTL71DRAFT_12082 [Oculimacula yallundae]|uniref:BTB domain-containing protein n=1 Tax=Oculimacula yallundae TaxID=86028 RepID=A0ABR4CUI2_9HELO
MADTILPSSSTKADTSRRDRETEEERKNKKRKMEPVTFSDPTAFVTLISGQGESETKFVIHKEVACRHSEVLKVAFESNFTEGQTQTYHFPESTKPALTFLMQYMYTQNLVVDILREDYKHGAYVTPAEHLTCAALFELWTLGDMLRIPKLQNVALASYDAVVKKTWKLPAVHAHEIYNRTSAGSMLRKYIVHMFVFKVGSVRFADNHIGGAFPNDLLMGMICYMKSDDYQKMSETQRKSFIPQASSFFVPEDES